VTPEEWRLVDEAADRHAELQEDRATWEGPGGDGGDGEDKFIAAFVAAIQRRRERMHESSTQEDQMIAAPEQAASEEPVVVQAAAPEHVLPAPTEEDWHTLEASLRSPEIVVVIPPAFNRPADENQPAIEMAVSCRRVLSPVEGNLVAIRPKPSCKNCNGSPRWTLLVKGVRRACPCVVARLHEALGIPSQRAKATPAPTKAAETAPVTDAARAERLREFEERVTNMQKERDAAVAPIEARIEEHARASLQIVRRLSGLADDQGELAAELAQRERMAAHYEQLAKAEREAVVTLATAIEEKRGAESSVRAEQASIDRELVGARTERQRVLDRWADRMRPSLRVVERLRSKLPPVHFETAFEWNGEERTAQTACDLLLSHGSDVTAEAMGYSADASKVRGCAACVTRAQAAIKKTSEEAAS